MLDIAQSVSSQVSRIFKLLEKEVIFNETRSIENRRKINSAKFKSGPSLRKQLGFESNTPKYRRKTLTTF